MYLVRIVFFGDEVNDGLYKLGGRGGIRTAWIIQLQSGLGYFLLQNRVQLTPHLLYVVCTIQLGHMTWFLQ